MFWGYYGWGMGFGWIMAIAVWVLVILGIIMLIKSVAGSGTHDGGEESALDILRKRYARGEINEEEFRKIKDDITKS
ncbi:MAG: SHOCT domain-containing protein [Candidatus Sulfobium sp.]|jgi:putative membrane protein